MLQNYKKYSHFIEELNNQQFKKLHICFVPKDSSIKNVSDHDMRNSEQMIGRYRVSSA